jgi:glycosyltransferase involved in cell wall biosynthesis
MLEKNILTLFKFLSDNFRHKWQIVIADNASTDSTLKITQSLAAKHDGISYIHLEQKGRGRALKKAWLESKADIVSYMDVDLSTNLNSFPLLVEGLIWGYDIAIGNRLIQAARTKRCIKREILSRIYNFLIKIMFFSKTTDAQCGFKALKRKVAFDLIPKIKNNNWFFDTELLLLAERKKYRIFNIPVEWIEDLGTRVNLLKTILEDLKGLLRMRFSKIA